MTEQYSARTETVRAALAAAGHPDTVRLVPDGAKTAAQAAAALGCEVGAIANSLVFLADGAPLLVLSSGRHRVDTDGLAQRLGYGAITRAKPDDVAAATGQVIGGDTGSTVAGAAIGAVAGAATTPK